jgi:hypothetical protein
MAFEGLRDQLKEQWADLSAKIQESSAYNSLRENFESQTPSVQKAILIGGAVLLAMILLSFPYGYLSDSSDNMTQFEENRELIQGLLGASRTAKEAAPLPPPIDSESLKSLVERTLHQEKLVPEQIGDIQAIPGRPAPDLAPAAVVQNGVAAQIKKLNVKQVVDIANAFQNLGNGTKLIGLDIVQTAGQTHYYDMIVRIVNFGLSPAGAEADKSEGRAPSRPHKGGNSNKPEMDE